MSTIAVPAQPARRILPGAVKLGASAAMVALAWRAAGSRLNIAGMAPRLGFLWIAAALVALNIGQIVAAVRLRYTLASLARPAPLAAVLRAHFIGLWFNQALPTGIGGDVAKVMTLREKGDLLRYARAVLLTRIIGLATLLACAVLLAPFYRVLVTTPRPLYAVAVVSFAALAGLALLTWASHNRRLGRALPKPARFLLLLARDIRRLLTGRALREQLITSAVIVISISLCFDLIARALGHGLGLWTSLVVVPPVIVSMHLPMSYAGWGTREVGAVVLLPLAGVQPQTALVISILYGVLLLCSGLIGLALWHVPSEPLERRHRAACFR